MIEGIIIGSLAGAAGGFLLIYLVRRSKIRAAGLMAAP